MLDIRFRNKEYLAFISSSISIFALISLITVLVLIFAKIYRLTKNLNKEKATELNSNYRGLTETLKKSHKKIFIYFWKPLILVRWSLTLFILVFLSDKPAF